MSQSSRIGQHLDIPVLPRAIRYGTVPEKRLLTHASSEIKILIIIAQPVGIDFDHRPFIEFPCSNHLIGANIDLAIEQKTLMFPF